MFPIHSFSKSVSGFSERFSQIDRLLNQLTSTSTPPHDLKQFDNENYLLILSVPGWKDKEMEIEAVGGRLTITGRQEVINNNSEENENNNEVWLHRGINRTDFRLSYSIPEHMKVTEAKLQDGLLNVKLYIQIPENEKPRRIPIQHNKNDVIEHQS